MISRKKRNIIFRNGRVKGCSEFFLGNSNSRHSVRPYTAVLLVGNLFSKTMFSNINFSIESENLSFTEDIWHPDSRSHIKLPEICESPGQVGKKWENLRKVEKLGKWDRLQKETKFIGICESRVYRGPGGLDPSSWVITITCYNHRVCQSQHCTLLSIDTIVQGTTCARHLKQLFALISVSCHKHWPTALYWRMI